MDYLPATTYNMPPRLGRGRPLKTIMESEEMSFGMRSGSDTEDSDETIKARPTGLDAKIAAARSRLSISTSSEDCSPIESSSPCSSNDEPQRVSMRSSYSGSDAGTVFSEDSCPSLTGSNDTYATTFHTNSSRNSVSSAQSGRSAVRNRYPAIMIPRDSWTLETVKEVTLGMSPAQKIMLSPQALSALPQHIPSIQAPPSLGDCSSMASDSPCVPAISSAPITPDLSNSVPASGERWGGETILNTPLEIAIDEHHSILLSPREAHSDNDRGSTDYSTDWSEIMMHFPRIPGATPQEHTPIEPNISDLRQIRSIPSDHGVQLPKDALSVLQHLTRSYSPDRSEKSGTTRSREEMLERAGKPASRPRSVDGMTPTLSDYSFSQLSIPSPGGFFSSLQANSRATWCMSNSSRAPTMPSSAVAENFYNVPFKRIPSIKETVLEVTREDVSDGPPTARQVPLATSPSDKSSVEDADMYGCPSTPPHVPSVPSYEYEDTYEDDLSKAAGVNIGRTNDWLSAQTSYLSALRETNPHNDPADYPPTPHPLQQEEDDVRQSLFETPERKAVRFLEEAMRTSIATDLGHAKLPRERLVKEAVFLEAFRHLVRQRTKSDSFLQAATRLESVNTSRLALPLLHIQLLLNQHTTNTIQMHTRPRYRGPFSQNPRQTGVFTKTREQIIFADAERKQLAIDHILSATWIIDAQRKVLYRGRLLACATACDKLTNKSVIPLDAACSRGKYRMRILDLAGAATASWGWNAASQWPNVKVYTVQNKIQAELGNKLPFMSDEELASNDRASYMNGKHSVKPETPSNHRVVSVPQLWQLPFKDDYFDVVSARSLYMFLRSRPIPNVETIDEWDLTLKECYRVLKPGGVLDYFCLDSGIVHQNSNGKGHNRDPSMDSMNSNAASISPSAACGQSLVSPPLTAKFQPTSSHRGDTTCADFAQDLKRRGYDADGGCSKLMTRLKKHGFVEIKRQWIGLPAGRTGGTQSNALGYHGEEDMSHGSQSQDSTRRPSNLKSRTGSVSHGNGRGRTPFPPAPRPISEVSTISHIINQYSNMEAVQGPVGSTADVSDVAGLLGSLLWEEWLVRLRIETHYGHLMKSTTSKADHSDIQKGLNTSFEAMNLLQGITDTLATAYSRGSYWRGVLGWARKPSPASLTQPQSLISTTSTAEEETISAPLTLGSPVRVPLPPRQSMIEASRPPSLAGPIFRSYKEWTLDPPSTYDRPLPSPYSNVATADEETDYYTQASDEDDHWVHGSSPRHLMQPENNLKRSSRLRSSISQRAPLKTALSLDTRQSPRSGGSSQMSPRFFTESAVERGEVGTIPMMIVEE